MLKNLTSINRIFLALLVIAFIVNVAVGQSSAPAAVNRSSQTGNDATTVFRSARDLITDGEWAKAQAKFDEYVKSYPNEKNIEAALYWLAYSLRTVDPANVVFVTIDPKRDGPKDVGQYATLFGAPIIGLT